VVRVVLDLEADGLLDTVTQIWVAVCKDIDTGEMTSFVGEDILNGKLKAYLESCDCIIGHNIIDYDLAVLSRLADCKFDHNRIIDTLVLSQLHWQARAGGHSLEAWGERLGFPKIAFHDFSKYSEEMHYYCMNDVDLNHKVYEYLKQEMPEDVWKDSIQLEHDMAWICRDMHEQGFTFDYTRAKSLSSQLETSLSDLDTRIRVAFPNRLRPIREVVPRLTKHGTISKANIPKDFGTDYSSLSEGCAFTWCESIEFNAGSPKQVIERLNEFGWKPVDKTKGHLEAEKTRDKTKLAKFKEYGWQLNERNLASLPSTTEIEEWVKNRRIKLQKEYDPKDIGNDNIKNTELKSSNTWQSDTSQTQERHKTVTSKEITELVLRNLKEWYPNNPDVVKFVESQRDLWLIIITQQGQFVDCSAMSATRDWNGLKDIGHLQKRISDNKAARLLVKRGLIAARLRTLTEWFESYNPHTGRVHGSFYTLGTWTHRLSHRQPNLGNIAAKKSIKYNGKELKALATELGGTMRSFWKCEEDEWLVSCDMDAAHMRIFAHLVNDQDLVQSIETGDKDLGTDPHTLNMQKFGGLCPDRDRAKTFIYTFFNGGQVPKVASIFGCDYEAAKVGFDLFVSNYPTLQEYKKTTFPSWAKRGYFIGLDGRKVACDSAHQMMAGILQNYEAVLMKQANVMWRKIADEKGYRYRQVNLVHDEYVTAVKGSRQDAEAVGSIQAQCLEQVGLNNKLLCPIKGSFKVGRNWLEIH